MASPLKEYFQDQLLWTDYSQKKFHFPRLVQYQDEYQFYSRICVCDLWVFTFSPSSSVSLTFSLLCGTKNLYRVYLLSSLFSKYIFVKVVFTTALCIFSVVIMKAPHWRLLVKYVCFYQEIFITGCKALSRITVRIYVWCLLYVVTMTNQILLNGFILGQVIRCFDPNVVCMFWNLVLESFFLL